MSTKNQRAMYALEKRCEGGRFAVCAVLGIHEQSYYKYCQGRVIPKTVVNSLWCHEQLTDAQMGARLLSLGFFVPEAMRPATPAKVVDVTVNKK